MKLKIFIVSLFVLTQAPLVAAQANGGLIFECGAERLTQLKSQLKTYQQELGVDPSVYEVHESGARLRLSLKAPSIYGTLYLRWDPKYNITEERISLPDAKGLTEIETVSKKEILLALMHQGRETVFAGNACHIDALKEHVQIRQMIVAWSEHLHWSFPDGSSAQWNQQYWDRGNLKPGVSLDKAMRDFFIQQDKCSIGCYTATKIVIIQGILDYFRRVKKDDAMADAIIKRLKSDDDVLVGIEPGAMWSFQKPISPEEQKRLGKLLKIQTRVAPMNFVPGDWVYFVNNDPKSSDVDGYEGSNSIYMGRASFDDFYNDNEHHYLYNEKIQNIYNWRNGVFSRSRHFQRMQTLSAEQLHQFGLSPEEGGFLVKNRAIPYFFGFEAF
ncbi:hypothetical protein GQ367_02510 [Polynucleobacter sp. MWH-CaK5]|uniref:hypothetical protein n=1 Tax=Polynucleobacter sp. MWH-CaK5 TaxID=2689107 RepID=UPI001BFE956C|nr:hypothetical protein [Polynucleobacter sp. MWH-CaK5]QWD89361.1 hypothetical protein GQ367_02510 [Polynucleobacter sp. MWH-CaK5]